MVEVAKQHTTDNICNLRFADLTAASTGNTERSSSEFWGDASYLEIADDLLRGDHSEESPQPMCSP
jgi:hypothetical protein